MSLVTDLGLPKRDIERIAEFMRSGGMEEMPKFRSKRSAPSFYDLTGPEEAILNHPLWRTVIGRFEEDTDGERQLYVDPKARITERYGKCVEDLAAPESIFLVSDPL